MVFEVTKQDQLKSQDELFKIFYDIPMIKDEECLDWQDLCVNLMV